MSELYYHPVSDGYKECSLEMPPYYRTRCRERAHYCVKVSDDSWYWRCPAHRDTVSLHKDGTATTGTFSAHYPSILGEPS